MRFKIRYNKRLNVLLNVKKLSMVHSRNVRYLTAKITVLLM